VQDSEGNSWKPRCWRVVTVIDDEWATKDKRFGWSVAGNSLVSRCGHEEDIAECTRTRGQVLVMESPNNTGKGVPLTEWREHSFGGEVSFLRNQEGAESTELGIASTTGGDAAWITTTAIEPGAVYRLTATLRLEGIETPSGKGVILYSPNIPFESAPLKGSHVGTPVEVVFCSGINDTCTIYCQLGGWGQVRGKAWFSGIAMELLARMAD